MVIGKTHLPELAIIGATESATFGTTRNPWDPTARPAARAAAARPRWRPGSWPAATASDGAGSIRIPAACCGIFGLKPSADLSR